MHTNYLICGDATEAMAQRMDESVDLIIADPPYNLGKHYGNNRNLKAWSEYKDFTQRWLAEAVRLLKTTGAIYIFMGFRFIARLYMLLEDNFKRLFNGWITWHYTQGMGRKNGFSPRHEDILYFTKSENFTFNLDAIRIPQKYYRERNNRTGVNPGDVWQFPYVHYCRAERLPHPTQKPEALVERIILASSKPNDLVLDPFVESSTTCKMAKILDRRWIGIDLNPDYIKTSRSRIEDATPELDSYDPRVSRITQDLPKEQSLVVQRGLKPRESVLPEPEKQGALFG